MDAFAWTVIGSVAGLVGAAAAVVFGLVPLLRGRKRAPGLPGNEDGDGQSAAQPSRAPLPAPVLDVEVRGREQVVEELAALALASLGRVQVLCGLGGSGKSTVARAVAVRIAAKDRRVWWVPAADAVSVTQLLLGLARELGASRGQLEEALAGRLNPSDVLWRQLEDAKGWTLVLDNADDPAALAADGRPASSGSGWLRSTHSGLVLVTSRTGDPQVWGPVAKVHRLEPLDEADGAQVLLDLAPVRLIGRQVRVVLRSSELIIYDGRHEAARHERVTARGAETLVLDHYLEALMLKPGALAGSVPLDQARASGVFTGAHEALWSAARRASGEPAATRVLVEVLLLHRHMDAADVITGIKAALSVGAHAADVVAVEARRAADARAGAPVPETAGGGPPAVPQVTSLTLRRLAALPADSRPLPTVSAYDQLLTRPRTGKEGQS